MSQQDSPIYVPKQNSKEDQLRISKRKKSWKDHRSRKRKARKREPQEIAMANLFKEIGINYLAMTPGQAFRSVSKQCEGKRVDSFPPYILMFLKQNYHVKQVRDSEDRILLHFKSKGKKESMTNFTKEIAEKIGKDAKEVQEVLDGLLKIVKRHLRNERKILIPGLCRIIVRFQEAKPKRQVRNPFKGGALQWAEAKDATNKVRVVPAKQLKDYVAEKVEVVEPAKKKEIETKKETKNEKPSSKKLSKKK